MGDPSIPSLYPSVKYAGQEAAQTWPCGLVQQPPGLGDSGLTGVETEASRHGVWPEGAPEELPFSCSSSQTGAALTLQSPWSHSQVASSRHWRGEACLICCLTLPVSGSVGECHTCKMEQQLPLAHYEPSCPARVTSSSTSSWLMVPCPLSAPLGRDRRFQPLLSVPEPPPLSRPQTDH